MDPSLSNKDIDGAWSNSLKERLLLLNVNFELLNKLKNDRLEKISDRPIIIPILMVQKLVP